MSNSEERSRQNLEALRVWAADPFILPKSAAAKGEPMTEERSREKTLRDEIAAAINGVSRENASNTPDFLLADFLGECLAAFERTSRAREKWYGKSLSIGCSEVGATQSVAALEDRQEVAPKFMITPGGDIHRESEMCHAHGSTCKPAAGVPSEATPSKEYTQWQGDRVVAIGEKEARIWDTEILPAGWSMPKEINYAPAPEVQAIHEVIFDADSGDFICSRCESHVSTVVDGICEKCAAPEVQETPTISSGQLRYQDMMGTGESLVGTPQKETPPRDNPCGACGETIYKGLSDDKEHDTATGRYHTCAVPEGVQGKEPQTFEEWWQTKRDYAGNWTAAAKGIAGHAYKSGEAAGRRSAITEIREWVAKNSAEAFDEWSAGYQRRLDHLLVKCSEMER